MKYVIGFGRTGEAVAKYFLSKQIPFCVWDDNVSLQEKAALLGCFVVSPKKVNWLEIEELVLSPGVPTTYPQPYEAVALAKKYHIPFRGDIDVWWSILASKPISFVGITGTNGKSTTHAIIDHVLTLENKPHISAGNSGVPVFSYLDLEAGTIANLEMSSYQLDILGEMCFDAGVLLNITPDHLERYKDIDAYVDSKKSQIRRVKIGGLRCIGIDSKLSLKAYNELLKEGVSNIIPMSALMQLEYGIYTQDNTVFFANNGRATTLGSVPSHLNGAHNAENVMAAYLVANHFNISADVFFKHLSSFKALPHRQELVLNWNNVTFINDSKATNAQAALPALKTFKNIYWIAGGLAKEDGIQPLLNSLSNVKKAFLIGSAANDFAEDLKQANVDYTICKTLHDALDDVKESLEKCVDESTVLLSPACASQDQFIDYEDRGRQFKQMVLQHFQGEDR